MKNSSGHENDEHAYNETRLNDEDLLDFAIREHERTALDDNRISKRKKNRPSIRSRKRREQKASRVKVQVAGREDDIRLVLSTLKDEQVIKRYILKESKAGYFAVVWVDAKVDRVVLFFRTLQGHEPIGASFSRYIYRHSAYFILFKYETSTKKIEQLVRQAVNSTIQAESMLEKAIRHVEEQLPMLVDHGILMSFSQSGRDFLLSLKSPPYKLSMKVMRTVTAGVSSLNISRSRRGQLTLWVTDDYQPSAYVLIKNTLQYDDFATNNLHTTRNLALLTAQEIFTDAYFIDKYLQLVLKDRDEPVNVSIWVTDVEATSLVYNQEEDAHSLRLAAGSKKEDIEMFLKKIEAYYTLAG